MPLRTSAKKLARDGALDNVGFLENDFEALIEEDIGEFDVIGAHGVLSWVSPEKRRALGRFAQAKLKPGGLFLLDFFNSGWVRQNLVRYEEKTLDGIVFRLHKSVRSGRVYKRVAFETGGKKFEFRERVRLFTQVDFEQMFRAVGLETIQVFGGYDLGAYDPKHSKRLIIIAKKKP